MGCSNARLLVQAPLGTESSAPGHHALPSSVATSPISAASDSCNTTSATTTTTTRMHLTGVDLVVERNGSYTLLLTPKTHKQLMPYVLRKKRFRILVDKARPNTTVQSNEPLLNERTMETNKEFRGNARREQSMQATIDSLEQVATDEFGRAQARFVGGRSIDRGNPEDDDENIQSDDEGMIEEIVTTVEEDKDLECKFKKKIETKKTIAQDPETHNKITKVVKTEVTEITRTITLNDQHDLARAKRELGIDDVTRLLPSASSSSTSWMNRARLTDSREQRYEPMNEIVTSRDFPMDSPIKQSRPEEKPILAEATTVGRGPVTDTIPSTLSSPVLTRDEQKAIAKKTKKTKKKSGLCSCTRPADDEQHDAPEPVKIPEHKTSALVSMPAVQSAPVESQVQGQALISSDMKQLIVDKKLLLVDYVHSQIFAPTKFFSTSEQDLKARKISSRILDLLRYDRCPSWSQLLEQLREENPGSVASQLDLPSMVKTYEHLLTQKQANLSNTFSTIHQANDMRNIPENRDYISIVKTCINERDQQATIEHCSDTSAETIENTTEPLEQHVVQREEAVEIHDEKAAADDSHDQTVDEQKMSEEVLPAYDEEQVKKMLADVSQHRPITLAEAIAYHYIDIEDPKLGLANDTVQRIKNLFRPVADESTLNLIRVKRSGEYLTDVNLAETNAFEKLSQTEPFIYQLQQSFEPTLDFNEKQFRSLTETISKNKEEFDQLQFDISRTLLPFDDMKESSNNDFSQSDSGYSMTTATHESLASKIKIEFEPIQSETSPVPPKRDDLVDDSKIDLDKATGEQLDRYELNQDLIQIIKSDFNGSDKTIGQAILSRELRLDSTDPNDVSRLNSLGIDEDRARILSTFFFPKNTRTIAYSPEPGLFVEAQTTYNADHPGHKTDTTIIQIQEKQLSSDHFAMQRQIIDDRSSPIPSKSIHESEILVSPSPAPISAVVMKDKPAPVLVKKRKSSTNAGLLACFKSKKPKAGTEQQGQPTVVATTATETVPAADTAVVRQAPLIDYGILPDGKRIYIDQYRDRPDMDMSYKPADFDNRFVLPISKPAAEYERPLTPEPESVALKSSFVEEKPFVVQSESLARVEPVEVREKLAIVQPTPIARIVPLKKSEDKTVAKKPTIDLHAAAVHLPEVDLVKPGPLPTLSLGTSKHKSSAGLCASCFGKKAAETKKRETVPSTTVAPLESKRSVREEEKVQVSPINTMSSPTNESTVSSSAISNSSILPHVNIDQFRDRNFQLDAQNLSTSDERSRSTNEQSVPKVALQSQAASYESSSAPARDLSVFSNVNIDQFRERTFPKAGEDRPKLDYRSDESVQRTVEYVPPVSTSQVQIEPVQSSAPFDTDASVAPRVNIDTFRERTLPKGNEFVPKSEQNFETTIETKETHHALSNSTPVPQSQETNSSFPVSYVNIDQFRERTFQKGTEGLPKAEERAEAPVGKSVSQDEPHYQVPTSEPFASSSSTAHVPTTDGSNFANVNIDQFRERNFQLGNEILPRADEQAERPIIADAPIDQRMPNSSLPAESAAATDRPVGSKVNIDQFRDRTFDKSNEIIHKSEDVSVVKPLFRPPTSESTSLPLVKLSNDAPTENAQSLFSQVNIDQFRERTFDKSNEIIHKSEEVSVEKPLHRPPTSESTSLPLVKLPNDASTENAQSLYSQVNIDQFRDRTFDKSNEIIHKSGDVSVEKPLYRPPTNESTSPPPTKLSNDASTGNAQSLYSQVNIDQFRDRTFDKNNEIAPTSDDRSTEKTVSQEVSPYSLPTAVSLTSSSAQAHPESPTGTNELKGAKVNIDQFRERTFDKSNEIVHASEDRPPTKPLTAEVTHYALATESPTGNDASPSAKVNIDQFRERTFEKSSEIVSPAQERVEATFERTAPTQESSHPRPIETAVDPSTVNIDQFRDRTFQTGNETTIQSVERPIDTGSSIEPQYESPSSEPVPLVSRSVEHDAYDIPRSSELQQQAAPVVSPTEEQVIDMTPATDDVHKSSGDHLSSEEADETGKSSSKAEAVAPEETSSKKKKKAKQSKKHTEKTAALLSTVFRQEEGEPSVPALNLPPIERDLSPDNPLRPPHRRDSDPLRVPNVTLPQPDVPLPNYDRPEVNMSSGQIKQTSEFAVPAVTLPAIPDLPLPDTDRKSIQITGHPMKAPHVQLPEVQYASDRQEPLRLPRIQLKTASDKPTSEAHFTPTIETGLALASPVDDMMDIQTNHEAFPVETDYAIKTESLTFDSQSAEKPELLSNEQKYTITDTRFIDPPELPTLVNTQKTAPLDSSVHIPDFTFQLPSPDPILKLPADSIPTPPSFDDDVPSVPSKIVPSVQVSTPPIKPLEKQPIEGRTSIKTKSSTLALCSCFGHKSDRSSPKSATIAAPKTALPSVDIPLPSSTVSSTLKAKGPLRAPTADLPPVQYSAPFIPTLQSSAAPVRDMKREGPISSFNQTEAVVPSSRITVSSVETKPVTQPLAPSVGEQKDLHITAPTPVKELKSDRPVVKQSPSFTIKAPAMNIPQVDLPGLPRIDAYTAFAKSESVIVTTTSQIVPSRTDSGLDAIVSSHIHPSSTFGTNAALDDVQQHPSVSSGFGSEIMDSITTKGYTLPSIHAPESVISKRDASPSRRDFSGPITLTEESRTKLIVRQDELKKSLATEISHSMDDLDSKKDSKALDRILTHGIDLIKDKKVVTYSELTQKLTVEHKNEAFLVDPVVRALHCAIETQGMDNLDQPEFALAIRDMVRHPAKQTYDTVTHLNKDAAPLSTTQLTKSTMSATSSATTQSQASAVVEKKSSAVTTAPLEAASSCFACGRSKSKSKLSSSMITTGLLDDRRRVQLNAHRNELADVLRDHIQSTQPAIRQFPEHVKEVDKLIRKSLVLVTQPKILSFEQMRNELKTEFKQTYYLVDPTVDIVRDTFDHCDITQMNEKINLDILDSNIARTAHLYNHQVHLLTSEEQHALKSNQLSWLQEHLASNELKEKKLTRKQAKELNRIFTRGLEILSSNQMSNWEELSAQLQREFPKAHDLSHRSVDLLKQAQKDGLFTLTQAPTHDMSTGKRRPSSLITERAKQNLKAHRPKIIASIKNLFVNSKKVSTADGNHVEAYAEKTLTYLEEQKPGQFRDYNDLKDTLKKDFDHHHQTKVIEQVVDVIEQAHATNQFEDIDKPEVQALMRDRLDGKPLVLKEMYVSLPARVGAYGSSKHGNDESSRYPSSAVNGDRTLNSGSTTSHPIARGLSWREANERARILFYRGKHPSIRYDEQAAAFDVRMVLETASGGTQEIPVTDSDVHELLNSCGVQWDGVNIISLVDHSDDVVRAAEQAALKVIREKGLVDLRTPPSARDVDPATHDDSVDSPATASSS